MEQETEVAALLREIGDAYRHAMDAAYDPTLAPAARQACVLAGMARLGEARNALLVLIDEETALPLIRAATQGEAQHDQ